VRVQQKALSILEQSVGVFEVGVALANGLDLGAAEGDPGLEFIEQRVVVAGGPVVGGVAGAGLGCAATVGLESDLGMGGGLRGGTVRAARLDPGVAVQNAQFT